MLKLAAVAEQANDRSVAIQRQAQLKAQKAKGASKLVRGVSPGSLTAEQTALIVALDDLNQVRDALNVHRILASDTIEEHLVQLIEKKANLFMAYAQESAIKDSSNMASDPDTGSLERELLELMRAEEDEK